MHGTKKVQIMMYFQVISLEGWTDVMYFVQDAHSFWNWLYFVLLIVVSKLIRIQPSILTQQCKRSVIRFLFKVHLEKKPELSCNGNVFHTSYLFLLVHSAMHGYILHMTQHFKSTRRKKLMKFAKENIKRETIKLKEL